jgi:hypothetical protein
MSDDSLPRDHEMASAYLDGELEQDERAIAEASPTTMGLVEAFAVVHDRLSDVPPADPDARDQALAAALAEFDALQSPPLVAAAMVTAPPPPAIPLFRRTSVRILSAAAAVLLVGIVGVAALNSGSDDDDSSSADEMTAGRSANSEAPSEMAADDSGAGGGAPADASTTIDGITGPASAPVLVMSEDELLALAELAASPDADGQVSFDTAAPATTTLAVPAQEEMPTTLARVAVDCPLDDTQQYVMDIIWVDTPAALIVDTESGEAIAMGADCTVLASATP